MARKAKKKSTKQKPGTAVAARPDPKAKSKRSVGQPAFKPTDEQRRAVAIMASFGVPETKICLAVLNTKGRPIAAMTLRKHFRAELDAAFETINANVFTGLYMNAVTPTEQYPGGNPTAQIFWAKTRGRHLFGEQAVMPGGQEQDAASVREMSPEDQGKRILFALEAAAHAASRKKGAVNSK